MLTRLSIPLLLIVPHMHLVANMPSEPRQPPTSMQTARGDHGGGGGGPTHAHGAFSPSTNARKKKGPTIITHHQLLVPTNLHVIPIQYHQNAHHTNHTTQLIPIYSYIPVQYNHWVPVHELTVIPLNRDVAVQKVTHYRAVERKNDDDEINRYRRFYGGYGSGLYFGGHGAGHGFHAYYG